MSLDPAPGGVKGFPFWFTAAAKGVRPLLRGHCSGSAETSEAGSFCREPSGSSTSTVWPMIS